MMLAAPGARRQKQPEWWRSVAEEESTLLLVSGAARDGAIIIIIIIQLVTIGAQMNVYGMSFRNPVAQKSKHFTALSAMLHARIILFARGLGQLSLIIGFIR